MTLALIAQVAIAVLLARSSGPPGCRGTRSTCWRSASSFRCTASGSTACGRCATVRSVPACRAVRPTFPPVHRLEQDAMAETAFQTTTIAAPPERVWAIAAHVEKYPEWAKDVKAVLVHVRDDVGRRLRGRVPGVGTGSEHPLHAGLRLLAGARRACVAHAAWRHHAHDRRRLSVLDGLRWWHRGALRPPDRSRRAAAGLRQAPRRGPHPQHGSRLKARAES